MEAPHLLTAQFTVLFCIHREQVISRRWLGAEFQFSKAFFSSSARAAPSEGALSAAAVSFLDFEFIVLKGVITSDVGHFWAGSSCNNPPIN